MKYNSLTRVCLYFGCDRFNCGRRPTAVFCLAQCRVVIITRISVYPIVIISIQRSAVISFINSRKACIKDCNLCCSFNEIPLICSPFQAKPKSCSVTWNDAIYSNKQNYNNTFVLQMLWYHEVFLMSWHFCKNGRGIISGSYVYIYICPK